MIETYKKEFEFQPEEMIRTNVLEAIPFEYKDSHTDVVYETDEFNSVCPWTGLPDFARLEIRYLPNDKLVELKSLKLYLTSFRNVGILQEHSVNRILNDLVALLDPRTMSIKAEFKPRGGISTIVTATYPKGS